MWAGTAQNFTWSVEWGLGVWRTWNNATIIKKNTKSREKASAALNMGGASVWFVQHLTSFTSNKNHTSHVQLLRSASACVVKKSKASCFFCLFDLRAFANTVFCLCFVFEALLCCSRCRIGNVNVASAAHGTMYCFCKFFLVNSRMDVLATLKTLECKICWFYRCLLINKVFCR